jgi:hypothetical protein
MKKTLVLYIGRGFNFFVIPPDIQMYTVKSGYMFPVTQEMRQRLLCLEKSLSQPAGIISDCSLEVIFIQQILAPVSTCSGSLLLFLMNYCLRHCLLPKI